MGCPIRISTDQRLLAAPHGFSQRATSFIASWCQGIHRMPLLRSKSTHHAQEPSTPSRMQPPQRTASQPLLYRTCSTPPSSQRDCAATPLNVDTTFAEPRQVNTQGALPEQRPVKPQPWQRPETHQNLIHPDKEQCQPHKGQPAPARQQPQPPIRAGGTLTCRIRTSLRRLTRNTQSNHQDRQAFVTLRGIEPFRLLRSRTAQARTGSMETTGFEPVTPCLQSRCSPS